MFHRLAPLNLSKISRYHCAVILFVIFLLADDFLGNPQLLMVRKISYRVHLPSRRPQPVRVCPLSHIWFTHGRDPIEFSITLGVFVFKNLISCSRILRRNLVNELFRVYRGTFCLFNHPLNYGRGAWRSFYFT